MRFCVAEPPRSAGMWMRVQDADIGLSLSTRALWGVFSNGEWRAERAYGAGFSNTIGHRQLTINAGLCYVDAAIVGQYSTGELMLEKYFSAPKVLRRLRGGISGPYVDAFADDLNRDG